MGQVLINAQTAAFTSNPFKVIYGRKPSLKAVGLAGAEVVTLQKEVDGKFSDAVGATGVTTLTATAPDITIEADGIYRVTKGSSAGAVTVQVG